MCIPENMGEIELNPKHTKGVCYLKNLVYLFLKKYILFKMRKIDIHYFCKFKFISLSRNRFLKQSWMP